MKIIQFEIYSPEGSTHPEIYGLGDDGKLYFWQTGKGWSLV